METLDNGVVGGSAPYSNQSPAPGMSGSGPANSVPPSSKRTPEDFREANCHTPPPPPPPPQPPDPHHAATPPRQHHPHLGQLRRHHSQDSQSLSYHPYPPPPSAALMREMSVESTRSHSPGLDKQLQHQQHQQHQHHPRNYSNARHHHHRPSEQQHLLACRGSPVTCCAHGPIDYVDNPLKRQRSTRSTRSTASRRRQNEDTCTTCLRATLHCYNVCILIIGCAALGVGVWLLVTDFGARNVTPLVDSQMYEVTTYLLISGGGAVALLAFCGCCGTIREDKCVLSFYGTTLAIVLINLGVACGLAFFFRGTISDSIIDRMKDTLTRNYGVDVRSNVENRRITESWDAMQRQLQCCGVSGNTTSKYSWVFYSKSTEWNIRQTQRQEKAMVPTSCCAKGDIPLCTGLKTFKGPPLFYDSHLAEYREVNPYLYTTGCYDKLIEYLYTYSAVVGCVAAVVPLFLVLGIIISFCLCSRVAGISSEEEVEL